VECIQGGTMIFEYRRTIYGYECDIYGHLNNANYQHIYEEARSDLLDRIGVSLKYLKENSIFIYLRKIEMEYLKGVPFGSALLIKSRIDKLTRVKSVWIQEMYDENDTLMNRAIIEGVFTKNDKPYRIPQDMEDKFRSNLV
jgi:YbgC/YbaW family acyl-CoA thioester hydrolase